MEGTQAQVNSELAQASEATGKLVGNNIKSGGFEKLDMNAFMAGLQMAYDSNLSPDDLQNASKIMNDFLTKQLSKVGSEWLAENAKKDGVISLPSGLQYKVIKQGSGAVAADGDQVSAHYTGKLIDGKIFDSSVERGEPLTIGVNQVIRGWTEALKMMPEGSKWELYIPYNLAYGERGSPPAIPPYSTLIFEIELIDVIGK
ncbi:MAG: FKBP-type peptidyl-prolyl cis-trans isomerase [Flavobacteriales bacterium]|nr:FKBP-type peptidyl-prolyl cis-trans isomerase [Flavobacteriales bacterium]